MKIDINDLSEGDKVYWNKGNAFYEGTFVEKTGDILDLKALTVKDLSGKEDEIVDVFLITEQEFLDRKKSSRPVKEKKEKVAKTPKAKVAKIISDTELKPTIKGLQALLEKDGHSIERGEKWYQYSLNGELYEYKGALRDIFITYSQEGMAGLERIKTG